MSARRAKQEGHADPLGRHKGPAQIERRLKRLMLLRVVMFTTLLLIAIYVETVSEVLAPVNPLYFLIVATYVLTIAYVVGLRLRLSPAAHAYGQVVMDLLVITGLVYVTGGGGAHAGFILLYPVGVLAGSVILYRRSGLTLAIVATAMYASLLGAVRMEWLPAQGLSDYVQQAPVKQLLYSVFVIGVACASVALTGSYLSESLRRVGQRLEEATEEVADLRELNTLIVNSIHSGLMITDRPGHVVYVNQYGAGIVARPASELRGRHVKDVLGAPLDDRSLAIHAGTERLARMDVEYKRPDGSGAVLGLTLTRLETVEAGRGGYLLVFQDLTAIRRLEREIRLKERLAAAGEMAAQLAHEIRNPLGSISGSAQVLLSDGGMSPEQGRLLEIITRESKRLSEALNQFLLLARPRGHQTHSAVDFRSVVAEAVTLLRNAPEVGEARRVEFQADPGPLFCLADRNQLLQVFWNLTRNGLEAMPDGGTLRVELVRQGQEVVLSVCDEGQGIALADHQRLFQPYQSSSLMGTGLGLAIVYQIVRGWHGDIVIRSTPPHGTVVEVRTPCLAVEEDADEQGTVVA